VSVPGSVIAPSVSVYVAPSFTLAAPANAIVGGTLLIVIVALTSSLTNKLFSAQLLSLTRSLTWNVPGPSNPAAEKVGDTPCSVPRSASSPVSPKMPSPSRSHSYATMVSFSVSQGCEPEPFSWTVPPSATGSGVAITAVGSSFRISRPLVISMGISGPKLASTSSHVPFISRANGLFGLVATMPVASNTTVARSPEAETAPDSVIAPSYQSCCTEPGVPGITFPSKIVPVYRSTLVMLGPSMLDAGASG